MTELRNSKDNNYLDMATVKNMNNQRRQMQIEVINELDSSKQDDDDND